MSNYGPSQFEKNTLRDLLKEGTREVHGVADQLISDAFLGSKDKSPISRATYRIFLSQLYYIYGALERGLRKHAENDIVGPTYFPEELNRLETVITDLTFYYGDNWEKQIEQLPVTVKYVERLEKLTEEDPTLLISHAYVRYQGDISGGQQIKKILSRLFQLPKEGPNGVNFFEFPNISKVKEFKEFYSGRMNELNLSNNQKRDLVNEAKSAFQMTIDVFHTSIVESARTSSHEEDVSPAVRAAVAKVYGKGCPLMQRNSSEKNETESQPRCPITAIRASSAFTYGILGVLLAVTGAVIVPFLKLGDISIYKKMF